MYAVIAGRNHFYDLLRQVFKAQHVSPTILELGVHNGSNTETLVQKLEPQSATAVDSWSSELILKAYSPFDVLPEYVKPLEAFSNYFGGPLETQQTFDDLYASACERLSKYACVEILRLPTTEAFAQLCDKEWSFDYIYIDANHQYEHVLRDLMEFSQLLKPNGFIQLNDCVNSHNGFQQNLGVLPALHQFMTRSDCFDVLAQTTGGFADVLIARKNGASAKLFASMLEESKLSYVEIPSGLCFSSRYVSGRMSYVL